MNRPSPFSSIAASIFFVLLAIWTLAPVLAELQGAVPGPHLGDNATGLWNVWWFTYAIEAAEPLFRTDKLFVPLGTQLSLHTHATTHSVLAWPLSRFSIVAAHNVAILLGLALNGICTWWLAYRLTGRMLPAIVAGALFACSAHVQLRVFGHINLVHAWVLPLFALALLRFERANSLRGALMAGAAGALVMYTDYYYAVYAGVLSVTWCLARIVTCRGEVGPPRLPVLRALLLALILVDLLLILLIAWSGGTTLELGSIRISARGIRNPLTVLWILLLGWALLRFAVSISVGVREFPGRQSLTAGLSALLIAALLAVPLLLALARVIAAGDYTSPRVLWRSSPAGADALTLVLGHPLHVLTGEWTRSAYEALDVDLMEQSLWLGLVPLGLIAVTWQRWGRAKDSRLWMVVALVFFVLSLGPFLRVGGFDTALPLPHAVLRYLPGTGNARIPARAVIMVNLAVAVLTAIALSNPGSRSRRLPLIAAALVIVETLPAPTLVQRLPRQDSIDEFLASSSEPGAIAELPTGLRDGFGEAGSLDHRALVHQLWHDRALVGGFVARLSARVRAGYGETPILANLIDLSAPEKDDAVLLDDAVRAARELGIIYLIVNRDTFIDARLPRATLEARGFRFVQQAGSRELYSTRQPLQ